jgi:methylated-DNA-[protein]-cysteine S-methyltransferase
MTVSPTLDSRFREAAAAAGLLDVAYDLTDSPVGTLLVATTDRGLCRISFDPQPDREAEWLAQTFGVRVLRAGKPVEPVRRQLDEYFEGKRTRFELPVDLRRSAPFSREILERLALVPHGETTTYGALARAAGRPQAARAVGTVMNRNPIPIVLPCHRVVGANGSLVGYGGGLERKELLLKLEGALDNTLLDM